MKKLMMSVLMIILVIGGIGISSQYTSAATIKHSGKCGDLDWEIDSDGVLTISGSGDYDLDFAGVNGLNCPCWHEFREGIKKAVVNVENVTSTKRMFFYCSNLQNIDLSGFDTSNVVYMESMFSGCSSLQRLDLSDFDTSKVTDMGWMFDDCSSLQRLDLSSFDTSNVTDMSFMFSGCSSLQNLDIASFDTSKVIDMGRMFSGCSSLQNLDIASFDTSKVIDMGWMFFDCSSLQSIDLSGFDTSNVTGMDSIFCNCSSLQRLDLSSFDTSNVTYMGSMFSGCSSLQRLDLSGFDTSKVTSMEEMFRVCSNLLKMDISMFDTSNVTSLEAMFYCCSNLQSLDLSGFDTSKVTDMSFMFLGCSSLQRLDLSKFDTSKVKDMRGMFYECSQLSTELCLKNEVSEYRYCFYSAATAKGSEITVSYSGGCTKKTAQAIVNTKSSNSNVYLKDAKKVGSLSVSNAVSGMKVSWSKQSAADGYEVYRKLASDSAFSKVKTLTATSFTDENVKQGTQYKYKVRSYCKIEGEKHYGAFSDIKTLYRVGSTEVTSVTNLKKGVKVVWKKAKNVDGYCIYKKVGTGSFKKVNTVESALSKTWTDTDVVHGKKYTYAVTPYIAKSFGKRSTGVADYFLKAAALDKVSSTKAGVLTIAWKKKDGVDGYQVYYSTQSDFSSGTKATKVKPGAVGVAISNLKSGKTYYAKERTYKTVDDKAYYSAWSTVKSVKVK